MNASDVIYICLMHSWVYLSILYIKGPKKRNFSPNFVHFILVILTITLVVILLILKFVKIKKFKRKL